MFNVALLTTAKVLRQNGLEAWQQMCSSRKCDMKYKRELMEMGVNIECKVSQTQTRSIIWFLLLKILTKK